jgi:hypothetical protein
MRWIGEFGFFLRGPRTEKVSIWE